MNRATKQFERRLAVVLCLLLVSLGYVVGVTEYAADRYISRVQRAAAMLRPGYIQLEKSTSGALINDLTLDAVKLTGEVDSLRALLRESRLNMIHFNEVATEYQPSPFAMVIPQAKEAEVLRGRAVSLAGQSTESFQHYEDLIDFIKRYNASLTSIERSTQEFNSTTDINQYAGQSGDISGIASHIRSEMKSLKNGPVPQEAAPFMEVSVAAFEEMADGFDLVALGLQIPADDVIYSGARQIEAVNRKIYETNHVLYTRDVLSSRTIKSVKDLREKLELISS